MTGTWYEPVDQAYTMQYTNAYARPYLGSTRQAKRTEMKKKEPTASPRNACTHKPAWLRPMKNSKLQQ